MKQPTFSIGRIFIFLAVLQALTIGIAAIGVFVYLGPPSSNMHSRSDRHRMEHRPRSNHDPENLRHQYIPLATLLAILLILIFSNILIARWILLPVQRLRHATKVFGRGDWTSRISNTRNDEFGELGNAFNEMAERIENQMKAERAIIAAVSHELRTPLTRLRVALELLEDEVPDSVQKLQTMTGDIIEIEQLIDNVFASARLSNYSNQGEMLVSEMRTVSAAKIVAGAVDRFKSRFPIRHIQSLHLCEDEVTICPILFRRALENLLENAHKYSDAETNIVINARPDIDHILFSVSSTGDPIPEDQRMKIFDPFFQLQNTQGTGLGLTLVKHIAEAHGGTASVVCESRKNTFVIRLPVASNAN